MDISYARMSGLERVDMKEFAGVALGFMLMPAVIGLIALFVWACTRFDLSRSAVVLGGILGVATLVIVAGVGIYIGLRT
jgi:energy-converting hydrogenase Eha subunit G